MPINRIGIELEGGWDTIPGTWAGIKPRIVADLSIDGTTMRTDHRLQNDHVGEVISPILKLSDWKHWLQHHYPQSSNITCGLHVHISFTTKREYALAMSRGLQVDLIQRAEALATDLQLPPEHYIWSRLQGENVFCLFDVAPEEQVNVREKRIGMRVRYAALNYCWSMHQTLEYRLLPMFETHQLAALFIDDFLLGVETFLRERIQTDFRKSCQMVDSFGTVIEKGR